MMHFDLAPNQEKVLDVRDIRVTYKNGLCALQHASFSLPACTITALVGANGSGKSTLFKAIMGFVRHGSGDIKINGSPIRQAQRNNVVAYVPQNEDIDWTFPVLVEDVVMMGRFGHMNLFRIPKQVDKDAVTHALDRVGMTSFRHRQIGELSGGQKKRVFIARSLAQESKLILLDEPFTGVDVNSEEDIMSLLKTLRDEGCTILISTHNLGTVPEFCDRAVLINRAVITAGLTTDVFTSDNLAKVFGGKLRQYIMPSSQLHDDADPRELSVISDDERPLVVYGKPSAESKGKSHAVVD